MSAGPSFVFSLLLKWGRKAVLPRNQGLSMLASKSDSLILALVVILSIVNYSSAQEFDNPISKPQPGEILTAGSTYNIVWTPNM